MRWVFSPASAANMEPTAPAPTITTRMFETPVMELVFPSLRSRGRSSHGRIIAEFQIASRGAQAP